MEFEGDIKGRNPNLLRGNVSSVTILMEFGECDKCASATHAHKSGYM